MSQYCIQEVQRIVFTKVFPFDEKKLYFSNSKMEWKVFFFSRVFSASFPKLSAPDMHFFSEVFSDKELIFPNFLIFEQKNGFSAEFFPQVCQKCILHVGRYRLRNCFSLEELVFFSHFGTLNWKNSYVRRSFFNQVDKTAFQVSKRIFKGFFLKKKTFFFYEFLILLENFGTFGQENWQVYYQYCVVCPLWEKNMVVFFRFQTSSKAFWNIRQKYSAKIFGKFFENALYVPKLSLWRKILFLWKKSIFFKT